MPATLSPAALDFLNRPLPAHLAMINPSGSPQLTVMWFLVEDGDFLFTTTTERVKFRNFEHDPRAAITIIDPDDMYRWVIVNGSVSIDPRDPAEFYRTLAHRYLTDEGYADWAARTTFDNRTVLRVAPRRLRTMGLDGPSGRSPLLVRRG